MKINLHVAGLSFNQSYSFIVLPGITMKNATDEKAKECRIVDKTDNTLTKIKTETPKINLWILEKDSTPADTPIVD